MRHPARQAAGLGRNAGQTRREHVPAVERRDDDGDLGGDIPSVQGAVGCGRMEARPALPQRPEQLAEHLEGARCEGGGDVLRQLLGPCGAEELERGAVDLAHAHQ